MPRKRATRAQTTRAKPKLENVGDDIVNGMAPSEREEKLESYIKDFDLKVEGMRLKLQHELKHIEDYIIRKTYYNMRLSLSQRDRKLTVAEYLAEKAAGEAEEAEDSVETSSVTTSSSLRPEMQKRQTVLDTISKYKSKRNIEPIIEEEGAELTVKKTRKVGRPKAGGVTFNADLSNKFVTPATSRNASALGWNTPMVTPKFDPRLPITPAQKRPALADELVISMAGSPIEVNKTSKGARNKTLQIAISEDSEDIEDFEIPDDLSSKNLEKVMNLLSNVMKKKALANK